MINIKNIVKSRFINGESLPEWYEDRLKICSECPLNSKNIEKTDKSIGRKSWELIAGAHCTDPECGCTITQKAKIEEEFCPQSKWSAIEVDRGGKLNIKTSSNIIELSFDEGAKKYIADYGEIPYKAKSSFIIEIKDKGISNLNIKTSCGCTSANPKYTKDSIEISIKYDTLRVGGINKNVLINYTKEGKPAQTIINIKGHVKNAR